MGGAPRELPVSSPRAAVVQGGSVPMGHAAALPRPRCALATSLTRMDGAGMDPAPDRDSLFALEMNADGKQPARLGELLVES